MSERGSSDITKEHIRAYQDDGIVYFPKAFSPDEVEFLRDIADRDLKDPSPMQVSFLSPPFGPAAFYLKSVAPPHITLPEIFAGFLPFICLQLLILAIILLVPEITTIFL